MKIKPRFFPYPVLSEFSDDYKADFKATILPSITNETFDFCVRFFLSDEGLSRLINEGKASYLVHIECPKTWKRIVGKTTKEEILLSALGREVHGHVDICIFIIATQNINKYQNKNFHSDFEDQTFTINKGEILAIGPNVLVEIEKEPIKNIESIFQIEKNNSVNAPPISISIDSNKIVVRLSGDNFIIYNNLKQNSEMVPLFLSLIAVPALTEVLETLKRYREEDIEDFEMYREFKWFRVIDKRLTSIGEDLEDLNSLDSPVEVAQKLIDYPLTKAFKYLENIIFEGEEDVTNIK